MRKNIRIRLLLAAALPPLLLTGCAGGRERQFEPLQLSGLEPRPGWWQVRPGEIIDACRAVKNGRSEVVATTPGGYPVYALFYGDFNDPPLRCNWSAASASGKLDRYLHNPDGPQTFMFIAGIHGAEPEGVAAAINLISLLETGRDRRGESNDKLLGLLKNYRLIILPCVNMDGRAISPDHLRQASFEDFLLASQGAWADGTLIGWRGSKEFFPLPLDRVRFPGGYPNAGGFNIMHDAAPGNLRTREAEAILRLAERYAVDFALNVHSHTHPAALFPPPAMTYPQLVERGVLLSEAANRALFEAGIRDQPAAPELKPGFRINLNNLIPLLSGGLGMTMECNVRQSFDQMADAPLLVLEVLLESGLNEPFSDRKKLMQ